MPIELIYYKYKPSMVRFIIGKENLKKYKGVDDRAMLASDIELMLNTPIDSVKTKVLDKLGIDWVETKELGNLMFTSVHRKETIIIYQGQLKFIKEYSNIFHIENYRDFLGKLKIEKEESVPEELLKTSENQPQIKGASLMGKVILQTQNFDVIHEKIFIEDEPTKENNPADANQYQQPTSSLFATYEFKKRNIK